MMAALSPLPFAPRRAGTVKVREMAPLPLSGNRNVARKAEKEKDKEERVASLFDSDDDEAERKPSLEEEADAALKKHFSRRRMLCIGTIFAVMTGEKKREIRFYRVIEAGVDVEAGDEAEKVGPFVVEWRRDTLILLPFQHDLHNDLLPPPPSLALVFFEAAVSSRHPYSVEGGGAYVLRDETDYIRRRRHPAVEGIIDALLSFSFGNPSGFGSGRCVLLHRNMDDGTDVQVLVSEAADLMGMRFVAVDGLAAHNAAHLDPLVPTAVRGSVLEKIAGLKLALRAAASSAPCILLLCDVDCETPTNDSEDTAERLALVLQEWCTADIASAGVWVVLSSESDDGPLATICRAGCVKVYHQDMVCERNSCKKHGDDASLDELLEGRPTHEMVAIRQRVDRLQKVGRPVRPSDVIRDYDAGPFSKMPGKSSFRSASIPDVRWSDVGGLEHIRAEIADAIDIPVRFPSLFKNTRRSGVLLHGPPGGGKTLVAKAIATECELPFFSVRGPELLASYVGESEANVRAAFQTAREAAGTSSKQTALLFFDELDSLAPKRGNVGNSGGGVMERVLSTLLAELDGVGTDGDRMSLKGNVVVIGATNRPDLLDPALLRPGRFDRLVYMGPPDSREARTQILLAQTRKFHFKDGNTAEAIINNVVDLLPEGLSGADLSAIAKGALMAALRRLCKEADRELEERTHLKKRTAQVSEDEMNDELAVDQQGLGIFDMDDLLDTWPSERLVPALTTADFVEAAKNVVPSVSRKDMAQYENLRLQFQ